MKMHSLPLYLSVVAVALILGPSSAAADDKLILAQKVELNVVDGNSTWVAVGNGPFKDRFPNGLDASGTVAMQKPGKPAPATDLTQGRIPPQAVNLREFGSIGATQGSIIQNSTGQSVKKIEMTTKGVDAANNANKLDPKSGDGDDFDTTINGNTITLTAKNGKELKKNERIWLLVPEGPQPSDPGKKIYEGKVELLQPAAAPAPQPQVPAVPKTGNQGGGASLNFRQTNGVGTLTFLAGEVDFATYFDGTTVGSSLEDVVIGSLIRIGDMDILGPSSDVPGALELSDSGISLVLNGETLLQAELTHGLLIPDPVDSGVADLQAALTFLEEGRVGIGSRYLDEHFRLSNAAGLFFRSNLLAATNGLSDSGSAFGVVSIASTDAVPEPGTAVLLVMGLAGFAYQRRDRHEKNAAPGRTLVERTE